MKKAKQIMVISLILAVLFGCLTCSSIYHYGPSEFFPLTGILWIILFFLSLWSIFINLDISFNERPLRIKYSNKSKRIIIMFGFGLAAMVVISPFIFIPYRMGASVAFVQKKVWMEGCVNGVLKDINISQEDDYQKHTFKYEGKYIEVGSGYSKINGRWVYFQTEPFKGFLYLENEPVKRPEWNQGIWKIEPHWYRE